MEHVDHHEHELDHDDHPAGIKLWFDPKEQLHVDLEQSALSPISGTIVGVSANRLTVQTGPMQAVVVNDEPALNRMDTGRIYTGRVITAYGYWNGGEFVATSIA